MTTSAATDRLVHHATILAVDRGSNRQEDAARRTKPRRRSDEQEGTD